MKTLLIAASALALSAPAQMEPAMPGTPTTEQSATMPSTQATPTGPAAPGSATAPTTATPSDPKVLIASEFPTYDKNADGNLDKAEFASWMGALKATSGAKPMPAAEMAKWADGAFATADADKSKSVTLAELQNYLTQGA